MVRIKTRLIAVMSLLALLGAGAFSQAQFGDIPAGGDSELQRSLQDLGYQYKVLDDGSIVVLVPREDGRLTPALISPRKATPQGANYRIIMVQVAEYDGQPPAEVTAGVQRINEGLTMGVVGTVQVNGKTLLIYGTPMPVNPSASALGQFLRNAVRQASQVKRTLNVA